MLDPVALVGLLADPGRRRVVAALVLDAGTLDEIVTLSGLPAPAVIRALDRLERSGLAVSGDGRWHLLGEAFALAARAAAANRMPPVVPAGPPGTEAVLRAFVRDGRLLGIPTVRHKRLVVLDLLAQEFEPGRRYPERTVNVMLGRWHDDTAALRRYLVDDGFLDRAEGEYWRSGGTVET